jgi:hypothetical protein
MIIDFEAMMYEFCSIHGFNPETANPAHDAGHLISGFPPTLEGEHMQAGWELAIMGVGIKYKLDYWPKNDEVLAGWLAGYDFIKEYPIEAKQVAWALQNL